MWFGTSGMTIIIARFQIQSPTPPYLCAGALIGTLPTLQHRVSGEFHIIDSKTIYIEDFNYDGGGPGMLVHH